MLKPRLLLTIVCLLMSVTMFAQLCNPNTNITTPSLPRFNDTLPCIVSGQAYNGVVSFKTLDTLRYQGILITVDSVRIDTISNLPCGIVWNPSKASRTYGNSELGCIALSGTTTDAVGQYELNMVITVYFAGVHIAYNVKSTFGERNFIRVKSSAGAICPVIDTLPTGETASCATPTPTGGGSCNNFAVSISGTTSICQGDPTTLFSTVAGATGTVNFAWSTGANTQNITVTPSGTGTTTYTVTAHDSLCVATSSIVVTTSNCNVTVQKGLPLLNDSVACVVRSQQYNAIVPFISFDTARYSGLLLTIDSVRIDTISDLPCGIVWEASKASRMYSNSEAGSIYLTGITNDAAGVYKVNMMVTLYFSGVAVQYNATALGFNNFLRVKTSPVATCLPIDTSVLQTASCVTPMPTGQIPSFANVWPGDADHNGVVDANDALQIAIEYGSTGPVRSNASLVWIAQPASEWTALTFGINDKHADCNGDGIITVTDTLAVSQNYSLTHNKTGLKAQANDPVISFVADTIQAGQDFHVKIMLGNAGNPVDSLYGIAFSMNLDPTLFDSTSAQLSLSNSWMGNTSNSFSFRKVMAAQGKVDMVLARTDHHDASGYGQIGELVVKAQPHISAPNNQLTLTPTLIKGITSSGNSKTYNIQAAPVVVSGINELSPAQYISLYPNPSNGYFTISIDQASKQLKLEMMNLEGQVLYSEQLKDQTSVKKELDFSGIAKGVYLLKVTTENGVAVKRMIVE